MMNESTKITDTKLTPSLKAAIKTHFPGVVTLGELKQFISDDPKALDHFSQRAVDIIMNILDFTDYDGAVSEPPATKQETALADAVKHAYDVHAQIILGAKMVENGLYQMAKGFKAMRDEKLYKELGYDTFEMYCEVETGLSRMQVYNYIRIADRIPETEFVNSSLQNLGVKKLSLLAALDDDQREEIAENTDLEQTSVKELKKQIDELTGKNKELTEDLENSELINKQYQSEIEDLTGDNTDLEEERDKLLVELKQAKAQAKEIIIPDPTESEEYKALQKKCTHLENELLAVPSPKVNYDEVDRRVTEAVDKMNHEYQLKFSEQQKNLAQMTQEKNERIYELQDKIKELEQKQTLTGYFLPVSIEDYSAICKLLKGTKYEKMIYSAKLVKF
jgi:hypothetical protein